MNPNFVLIFLCLFLGLLLGRTGKFPTHAAQALNTFVIWISLPALVLVQFPALLLRIGFGPAMLIPVSMAWILFLLSFLVFNFLGKRYSWSPERVGALTLTAGLGNTSFVGLPMLESYLGQQAVQIGILVDQPGTFLVLSTVGILFASSISGPQKKSMNFKMVLHKVLMFPPFVALALATFWSLSGTYAAGVMLTVLEKLAATLVPLALVAVGLQLKVSPAVLKRQWRPLCLGLGFKLFLSPLFFSLLYFGVFSSSDFTTKVTVLESAMASMITSGVVAKEFHLDGELADLMLGIGIPLSFITVYFWQQLIF